MNKSGMNLANTPQQNTISFNCKNCDFEMFYDGTAKNIVCPCCGASVSASDIKKIHDEYSARYLNRDAELKDALKNLVEQKGTEVLNNPKQLFSNLGKTISGARREVSYLYDISTDGLFSELSKNDGISVSDKINNFTALAMKKYPEDIVNKVADMLRFALDATEYEPCKKKEVTQLTEKSLRDFDIQNGNLVGYKGQESKIHVPAIVKKLDKFVFAFNNTVKEVILPDLIQEIPAGAFAGCQNLEKIILPENLKTIEENAFRGCEKIYDIRLPASIETIKKDAFSGAFSLNYERLFDKPAQSSKAITIEDPSLADHYKECLQKIKDKSNPDFVINGNKLHRYSGKGAKVVIPSNINVISPYAFKGCESVKEVIIPSGVKEIPMAAFTGCRNLEKIVLPDQLTKIQSYAFEGCAKLREIILPESVNEIAKDAFTGASININYDLMFSKIRKKNKDISIGDSWLSEKYKPYSTKRVQPNFWETKDLNKPEFEILNNKLYRYNGKAAKVVIPSNINAISSYAFKGCETVKEVTIPSGVKEIPMAAFTGCRNLEKVVLPDQLARIQSYAFEGCSKLREIVLPESITEIAKDAFIGASININYDLMFSKVRKKNKTISIGDSWLSEKYRLHSTKRVQPKLQEIKIQNSPEFEILNNKLSRYNGKAAKVVIPSNINAISPYAFKGCESVKEVIIPFGVKEIPMAAFTGCRNLEKVVLPDQLTRIQSYAFEGCWKLREIVLPASINEIEKDAFYGAGNIDYDLMFSKVEDWTKKIKIEDSWLAEKYDDYNLRRIQQFLQEIQPQNKPEFEIRNNKLSGYSGKAAKVIIPSNINAISPYAFKDCDTVKEVIFPFGVKEIPMATFTGCRNLEKVVLPDQLTKIGTHAFRNCGKLKEIVLPISINEIEKDAFYGAGNIDYDLMFSKVKDNNRNIIINDAYLAGKYRKIRDDAQKVKKSNTKTQNNKKPPVSQTGKKKKSTFKSIVYFIAAAGIIIASIYFVNHNSRITSLLEQAQQYRSENKYSEAIDLYESVIDIDSTNSEAIDSIENTYYEWYEYMMERSDFEGALKVLETDAANSAYVEENFEDQVEKIKNCIALTDQLKEIALDVGNEDYETALLSLDELNEEYWEIKGYMPNDPYIVNVGSKDGKKIGLYSSERHTFMIYYGDYRAEIQRYGNGCLLYRYDNDKENKRYYYTIGEWDSDYPNGTQNEYFRQYKDEKLIRDEVTTINAVNGVYDGEATRKDSLTGTIYKGKYEDGIIQVLGTETYDGETYRVIYYSADKTGYYYFENEESYQNTFTVYGFWQE